jgi:small subunit ribosomal protein S20
MVGRKTIDSHGKFPYHDAQNFPNNSSNQESDMANHPSAEKRARVARRRAARNAAAKKRMRTALKKVRSAKEKGQAATELRKTVKLLDQLAAKGVIHKNAAANQKSKLTRFVNAMK